MRQCQPTKQWSGNDTFCEGIFEIILLLLIENELKLTEELQRKKIPENEAHIIKVSAGLEPMPLRYSLPFFGFNYHFSSEPACQIIIY